MSFSCIAKKESMYSQRVAKKNIRELEEQVFEEATGKGKSLCLLHTLLKSAERH